MWHGQCVAWPVCGMASVWGQCVAWPVCGMAWCEAWQGCGRARLRVPRLAPLSSSSIARWPRYARPPPRMCQCFFCAPGPTMPPSPFLLFSPPSPSAVLSFGDLDRCCAPQPNTQTPTHTRACNMGITHAQIDTSARTHAQSLTRKRKHSKGNEKGKIAVMTLCVR